MRPPLKIRKIRSRTEEASSAFVIKPNTRALNLHGIRNLPEQTIPKFDHTQLETMLESAYDLPDFQENRINIESWSITELLDEKITTEKGNENEEGSTKSLLAWCLQNLAKSQTVKSLLDEAAQNGWYMTLEDLDMHDFHLDVPEKLLSLNTNSLHFDSIARSPYFMNTLMMSVIRGLRDIWQEKRHGSFESNFGPYDVVLLERIRSADLDLIAILCAWELREEGSCDVWRHVIGSPQGDVAMAFSQNIERKALGTQNWAQSRNKALWAAFCQWHQGQERINAADHETLDYLENALESQISLGTNKPVKRDVEVLSCMPDKTGYLIGHGMEILHSPDFAGFNSDTNQEQLMDIIQNTEVTFAGGLAFRDGSLAKKLFPHSS